MSDISRRVINLFEFEELLYDFKKAYSFNLEKDLKRNGLCHGDFDQMIQDLCLDVNATPIKGKKITAAPPCAVYKMRYKDENRNIGSSNAYRLLCMVDETTAIPFHLYHKTSGSSPKTDLCAKEKKICKKMVEDAVAQKKGGKRDV